MDACDMPLPDPFKVDVAKLKVGGWAHVLHAISWMQLCKRAYHACMSPGVQHAMACVANPLDCMHASSAAMCACMQIGYDNATTPAAVVAILRSMGLSPVPINVRFAIGNAAMSPIYEVIRGSETAAYFDNW